MDPELVEHLKRLEIEPQIFLLRWIRLLFCREFDLEELRRCSSCSCFAALGAHEP